jgi:hypothetical protein
MTATTPGPWFHEEKFDEDGTTSLGLGVYAGRNEVARLPGIGHEDYDNARLIAAAPDLLKACKATLAEILADTPVVTDGGYVQVWISTHEIDMLRAAIAKATGK